MNLVRFGLWQWSQSEFFIKALKSRIRETRFKYIDLAKELGISEAGVKKILNNNDISISRAFQICNALGIDISEVISAAEENLVAEKQFTDQQINYFLKQPNLFFFYMRLAYEKKELDELKREHRLSDNDVFKLLKKLDDLGLIKLGSNNHFSFVDGEATRLRTMGTRLNDLKFVATKRLLQKLEQKPDGFLGGGIFFLTQKQLEELKADIFSLHDKYSKFSMENRSPKNKTKRSQCQTHTTMIMSVADTLFDF